MPGTFTEARAFIPLSDQVFVKQSWIFVSSRPYVDQLVSLPRMQSWDDHARVNVSTLPLPWSIFTITPDRLLKI